MIESQTKLPVQEDGSATAWTKGRQAVANTAKRVERRFRNLPGSQVAGSLRSVGAFASNLGRQIPFSSTLSRFFDWARIGVGESSLLNRFALHLVVVLLAVGVVAISQVSLPKVDLLLPTPTPAPDLGTHTIVEQPTNRGGGSRFVSNNAASLFQAPVPHTIVAERDRMAIITYTVQPNDNVWAIAQGFGLQVETIMWANPEVEKAPDLLSVGQVLRVLPVDGIYYAVQAGDTVEKIAKNFQVESEAIVTFELNALEEPYTLTPGQMLVVPGGRKKVVRLTNYYPMTKVGSAPAGAAKGSGRFAWPAQGYLSQAFWSGHPAIDIAGRTGVPILAADSGYVVLSGRDTWGYGNQVVIDHGNGFLTRYAHLQTILVQAGQSVQKNQKIGTMGSTGRSTGPHLHFEVIQSGVRRNPLGFLP
jgi:murein DD-endopeptidase MepM/ murein hydrolase activator NlpD